MITTNYRNKVPHQVIIHCNKRVSYGMKKKLQTYANQLYLILKYYRRDHLLYKQLIINLLKPKIIKLLLPIIIGASTYLNAQISNSSNNENIKAAANIAISQIFGDAGMVYSQPKTIAYWSNGKFDTRILTSITMSFPANGYVVLIHNGFATFFNEGRRIFAGIGTDTTNMINKVGLGFLDGSEEERYNLPYTVTLVLPVTKGTQTFYALGSGSEYNKGQANLNPQTFIGVFFPK